MFLKIEAHNVLTETPDHVFSTKGARNIPHQHSQRAISLVLGLGRKTSYCFRRTGRGSIRHRTSTRCVVFARIITSSLRLTLEMARSIIVYYGRFSRGCQAVFKPSARVICLFQRGSAHSRGWLLEGTRERQNLSRRF